MATKQRECALHPFQKIIFRLPWVALLLSVALFFFPKAAFAFEPPPIEGHVTDRAQKLDAPERAALEQKLSAVDAKTGNEIAVLLLPSLGGETIEDVAYTTFNTWKLGKKGRDNGVLLVIATADRKIRIETGKGVGGALTDLESGRIIREKIAPSLKQDRYAEGIEAGCDAIAAALANGGVESRKGSGLPFGMSIASLVFILLVAVSVLMALAITIWIIVQDGGLRTARRGGSGAGGMSSSFGTSSLGSSFSAGSSSDSSFSSGGSDFSGGGGCSGGGGASDGF